MEKCYTRNEQVLFLLQPNKFGSGKKWVDVDKASAQCCTHSVYKIALAQVQPEKLWGSCAGPKTERRGKTRALQGFCVQPFFVNLLEGNRKG